MHWNPWISQLLPVNITGTCTSGMGDILSAHVVCTHRNKGLCPFPSRWILSHRRSFQCLDLFSRHPFGCCCLSFGHSHLLWIWRFWLLGRFPCFLFFLITLHDIDWKHIRLFSNKQSSKHFTWTPTKSNELEFLSNNSIWKNGTFHFRPILSYVHKIWCKY